MRGLAGSNTKHHLGYSRASTLAANSGQTGACDDWCTIGDYQDRLTLQECAISLDTSLYALITISPIPVVLTLKSDNRWHWQRVLA